MKHELSMKTSNAVENLAESIYNNADIPDEVFCDEIEKITNILEKYFKYAELVTIIVDTENNTLTVKPLQN